MVALSWDDAVRYCNWLSEREGLPPAYDLDSGALLDENGMPTSDVSTVRGFRLPTEAEWEFAARERGRTIRFGNGQDVARVSEITFDAGAGDFAYLERGGYPGRTTPVGSHPPNDLGLYDMSGNAWEWVSDRYGPYGEGAQTDPYVGTGDEQILRGGRWGGDAFEARVFHRSAWVRNDRCNNSGFRVARSAILARPRTRRSRRGRTRGPREGRWRRWDTPRRSDERRDAGRRRAARRTAPRR